MNDQHVTEEPTKRCHVCNGRGYFHCACWPGDCICSWGDEDCEECDATGWLDDNRMYDDY